MNNKLIPLLLLLCSLTANFAFGQWENFVPPIINFQDKDNGSTEGAKIYHRLVEDKKEYISPVCEDVARQLFFDDSQPIKVTKLDYVIENYNGISEKGGSPPVIYIRFSTKHVADTWKNSQNDTKVEAEIYGVLFHEMSHGYQLEPKGAGTYDGKSQFWAKIEGEADAVRIRAGYHQDRKPNDSSKKWLAGYTTTGFFYNWIANNYDKDFLRKLNLTVNTVNPWTFEKAVQQVVNKSAQALWDEYVSVINQGSKPVPVFSADKTTVGVGGSVKFENTTSDALYYDWTFEGGTPRKTDEKNPTVKYNKKGVYKVTLVAHNKNAIGPGIEVKQKYITVDESTGVDGLDFEELKVQAFPNPFSQSTTIKFNLAKETNAVINIYNLLGEEIKTFGSKNLNQGVNEYVWDGKDNAGNEVASGHYIFKLVSDDFSQKARLVYSK